jgi:hypothetical protein
VRLRPCGPSRDDEGPRHPAGDCCLRVVFLLPWVYTCFVLAQRLSSGNRILRRDDPPTAVTSQGPGRRSRPQAPRRADQRAG